MGDTQDEVGGRDPLPELPGELEADDTRNEHGDRLAEHGSLGLDAADPPADDAQPVDHGGVGVGAHAGVRVGDPGAVLLTHEGDAGQVFQIHLVDDASARRDDAEVLEGRLPPPQELVALPVAVVLDAHVGLQGVGNPELLDDDGVVDDHLCRGERIDLVGVSAEVGDGFSHGGEIDDARHPGEVLHDDARRGELDLMGGLSGGVPLAKSRDLVGSDVGTVLGAQQILQQDLQAVRKVGGTGNGVDVVDLVGLTIDVEGTPGAETVDAHRMNSKL